MTLTRSRQDYLKALFALSPEGGAVSTSRIARRLGVSAPSVTHMLGELARERLVSHAPRAGARLTPSGRRAALAVVRRHRVIETFLVEVLALDWADVHDDAEQLEHAVSPRVLEALERLMGHPAEDPHGHPIPDRSGRMRLRRGLTPLATLARGVRATVRQMRDADARHLTHWKSLGLVPGAHVVVRDVRALDHVMEFEVAGHRHVTALAALDGVLVERATAARRGAVRTARSA